MNPIGKRVRPIDWEAQTSGAFAYTADIRLDDMLHAAVLRSPHAHARIVSIDTSRAEAMPGVRAVITMADFPPGVRYIHEGAADRPPLADGAVRFVGQEVAAVAAETARQARAALGGIRIKYRRQRAAFDLDEALAADAPTMHARPLGRRNLAAYLARDWGDFALGKSGAVRRASGTFEFAAQHHACMEPSTVIARWLADRQRLELWSPTGAPYYVVRETAHILGLDPAQVVCREVGVGGSFGARTKICDYEVIAGQLSRKSGLPVRLALSRQDEFATTKGRHAARVEMAVHGDDASRLRAIEARLVADNGAYSHSGGSVVMAALKGLGMLYEPDGARLIGELIDTAKRPGGQFRGYGTTQSAFALECLVDELAEAGRFDPLAFRIANANQPGSTTLVGAKPKTAALDACLDLCGKEIGWSHRRQLADRGIGIGFASAVHVSGAYVTEGNNRSDCAIDLHGDGRIHLRHGSGDAGTGQKTIMAQLVASRLEVPMSAVSAEMMDSERTPFDQGSWSSRGTHYGGHAALAAGKAARERLIAAAEPVIGEPARLSGGMIEGPRGRLSIGEAVEMITGRADGILTVEQAYVEHGVELTDPATGTGNISASYNFAGHAAKVEVCRRTGKVKLLDYVAAHDVGVAINPTMVEGQIIGGTVMGIGAALGEETVTQQGRIANPAYVNYAMPRPADTPRVRVALVGGGVGGGDENGPAGAKAVGEIGINPPVPAIANAIYDAVGIRLRATPFTPDKVLSALNGESWPRRFPNRLWHRPGRWWIALVREAYRRGLFDVLHRRMLARAAPSMEKPVTALARAATSGEALARVADGFAPLAGGIDLLHRRKQTLVEADRMVSMKGIVELTGVERSADGGWLIGAAMTLEEAAAAIDIAAFREAIATIATPQVRNMATVGGNLLQANRCWFLRNGFDCFKRRGGLAPCYAITGDHRFHHAVIDGHRCQSVTPSDLATVLTALDASAVIAGPSGTRVVALAGLYTGPGETVLAANEILAAVRIPPMGSTRTAFEKLALWDGDFALVSVAVAVDDRAPARIVFGGVAPVPFIVLPKALPARSAGMDGAAMAPLVEAVLARRAHPLPGNLWKLDAATGLAAKLFDRLAEQEAGAAPA